MIIIIINERIGYVTWIHVLIVIITHYINRPRAAISVPSMSQWPSQQT